MTRSSLVGGLLMALWSFAAGAAVQWDADASNSGADDGGGTWDTTGTNWWDGVANVAWVNGTNSAIFGGAAGVAGTVTLGEPVTAGVLIFTNAGGGSYTIAGTNALTLVGNGQHNIPAIIVTAGLSATISADLRATASNSFKRGAGTLELAGNVITTGREFHLDGGVVNFSGPVYNGSKLLVGSGGAGAAVVLNWNSGSGSVTNNYLGISDNGSGTMNLNGGTFRANNAAGVFIGNNVNFTGVLNVAGGDMTSVQGPLWIAAGYSGMQNTQPTWGYLNLSNGTFTFTGSKVQLTGTNQPLNTAVLNLDGGTFNLNGSPITNGAGSGTVNFNGGVLRFTANNGNALAVQRANVRGGGAIFDFANNVAATIAQALEHSNVAGDADVDGGLTKRGTNSTLTLTGNNVYTGPTRVHAGILQMGGGGASGLVGGNEVIISNNAQFVFRRSDAVVFTNKITGTGIGGVLVQGTGVITLTGTNNAWGLTYPQTGTLEFNLGDGTFTGSGKFSMNGAATAVVNWVSGTGNLATGDYITFADNPAANSTLNVIGGTLNFFNTGNRVLIGNQGVAAINVAAGTLNIGNGGSSKVPLIIGGDTQWDQSNARGELNVLGAGTVVVAGGSTLVMGAHSGVKTNATGTINLDGGILQLARDVTRGASGNGLFNFNGGRLVVATNSATFMAGLTRANVRNGGALIEVAAGAVTIGQALEHSDLPGDDATDGGLVKLGAGTLTLTNANTFTGPAVVSNGVLALADDGSLSWSTAIVVRAGATLAVTGRVDGTLALGAPLLAGDGLVEGDVSCLTRIQPGVPVGTLTVSGDLDLSSTAALDIEIGGSTTPGADYDQLQVGGQANINGALNVAFINGYTGTVGDAYVLLNAGGAVSGTFATTNLPAPPDGGAWTVQYLGSFILLSIASSTPPAGGYDLYAGQIPNAADRGYQNDPDGDGYANLLEYVTGGNPTNSDTVAQMKSARTNGVLALKFSRSLASTDATLYIEGSYATTNDATWTGIATNLAGSWGGAPNVSETGGPDPMDVTVADTDPAATNRFLRLRVTRP